MMTTAYITGSKIKKKFYLMKSLIVIGLILMTISFATLIFFTKLIPFIAVLVISSVGTGMVLPCLNSFITGSVEKTRRGFVTSLYGSVRFLGVAFGPPVFGWLMEWSRTGMFLSTAGLTFIVAILSLAMIHVKPQSPSSEEIESLFQKLKIHFE